MKKGVTIFWTIIIVLIVLGIATSLVASNRPGKYDDLAMCIKNNGVVFYGAFWCPHCQATKALFGKSAKLLPYTECSTPDGQGQLKACTDKGVSQYPTWIRPDGAIFTGEHTIAEWAAFSGCSIDGQKTEFAPVGTPSGASSNAQ